MSIRATTNAAAVAPAIAATAEIFAAGERINIATAVANQRILARLTVTRVNGAAGGSGTYRLLVNEVGTGTARNGPTGLAEQGLMILEQMITIAAAGAYRISAQVTSNVGVETVSIGAVLVVHGG